MFSRIFLPFILLASLAACSKAGSDNMNGIGKGVVIGHEIKENEKLTLQTRNRQVSQFATDSYTIFRELKNNFAADYQSVPQIAIEAFADLQNQSGESIPNARIFEVVWNRADLERIDFNRNLNVFTDDILGQVDHVQSFNLAGDLVLMDYCMVVESNPQRETFCNKVIEGLHNK